MTSILAMLVGLSSLAGHQDRTLTVFAAASLKDAFTTIAHNYESSHAGVRVNLSFAGSQQLAAQIRAGAEVDILAAAAPGQIEAAGTMASPIRTFAYNALTIVVPAGDTTVGSLADVAKAEKIVVADATVPAGGYTVQILNRAKSRYGAPWRALIDKRIVSREADVRAVLAKVIVGEADAGFVYVSDAHSAGNKVKAVAIPPDINVRAVYPIAIPSTSKEVKEAKSFINFIYTPESQKVLVDEGFISPLRAERELKIVGGTVTRSVIVSRLGTGSQVTVRAKDQHGTVGSYKGAPLLKQLAGLPGENIRLIGADGYTAQVSISAIKRSGGVLVGMGDGNLQVVLPGQPPSKWVKWLRQIVVY